MSKMNRVLAWVLAAMLILGCCPMAAAEEAETGAASPEEIILPEKLMVGNTTKMKGDFFTEMFGNNTADIDVRALIHGYNLVDWDQGQGEYVFNDDVVTSMLAAEDLDGNRTFFLVLEDDLYYSDGSPINAWDYAFSLLLMMSPEIEEIGGKIYRAEHILGSAGYITGASEVLAGVRVIDDRQIAITLDNDFLPYFFEVGLLLCEPYPISVIAPGCRVYDDGEGVYIGNADPDVTEPIYTAELLRQTILDPETGYNSHPAVVSGPYVMTSFDGVTAEFEINPYFKRHAIEIIVPETEDEEEGDQEIEETAPADAETIAEAEEEPFEPEFIERISFTLTTNEDMISQLTSGELNLVNKVTYGPVIDELMQARADNGLSMQNYARVGLSFFTFTCDWPTVHEQEVRQAIAWCMDRDALTREYAGNYGIRVDGYYGLEQWEYLLIQGTQAYPIIYSPDGEAEEEDQRTFPNRVAHNDEELVRMTEAWEALNLDGLTAYTVDEEQANLLLDRAGWTLNKDGERYNAGTDAVRCKNIEGELVALELSMLYPEGNHIIDTLQENFIDHLNACGIQLTLVPAGMDDLLTQYYREADRTTDMIYLATNFHIVVDPSITYSADPTPLHAVWNNTYSDDERLYQLAVDMRKTEPGDYYTYVTKWIAFQERYNEVLPAIPLYSNIYFDFFTEYLQNYYVNAHTTWSQAALNAFFGIPAEEPEETEEEGEEFGEEEFEIGE